jgi:hypothetical protein
MKISRIEITPVTLRKMGRAMLNPSLITPAVRSEFLQLDFPKQAELIGIYARRNLKLVDRLISKHISIEQPKAADLWVKMVEYMPNRHLGDSGRINELFPILKSESQKIAQLFASTYAFWVNNFYSCDLDGAAGTTTYKFSKALCFKEEEIQMISKKSGMPYLGQNIKQYANFLFFTSV